MTTGLANVIGFVLAVIASGLMFTKRPTNAIPVYLIALVFIMWGWGISGIER